MRSGFELVFALTLLLQFASLGQAQPRPPSPKIPSPSPALTGTARGDPHFDTFHGKRFEFTGFAGGHFAVWSSKDLQVNMRLASFGQPGATFIQAIGILVGHASLRASVTTPEECKLPNGTDVREPMQVLLGKTSLRPGQSLRGSSPWGNLTILHRLPASDGQEEVVFITSSLRINIVRALDGCHLDLGATVLNASNPLTIDGLLGHTIRCALDPATPCTFHQDEASYLVSGLFEHDAITNQFASGPLPLSEADRSQTLRRRLITHDFELEAVDAHSALTHVSSACEAQYTVSQGLRAMPGKLLFTLLG